MTDGTTRRTSSDTLKGRIAKATAVLERLDRQAVTLERLDALALQASRLSEAGVSFDAISARRDELNALADDGVRFDFNDALRLIYEEMFGRSQHEEEG
jgi:hypothetical protein